jgi:hypothetical protein
MILVKVYCNNRIFRSYVEERSCLNDIASLIQIINRDGDDTIMISILLRDTDFPIWSVKIPPLKRACNSREGFGRCFGLGVWGYRGRSSLDSCLWCETHCPRGLRGKIIDTKHYEDE